MLVPVVLVAALLAADVYSWNQNLNFIRYDRICPGHGFWVFDKRIFLWWQQRSPPWYCCTVHMELPCFAKSDNGSSGHLFPLKSCPPVFPKGMHPPTVFPQISPFVPVLQTHVLAASLNKDRDVLSCTL